MIEAGKIILKKGCKAVILKGGHLKDEILTDYLITNKKIYDISSKKIKTSNTHGTGCTFASAVVANLANSLSLEQSFYQAHKYVHNGILTSPNLGEGNGPINHCQ